VAKDVDFHVVQVVIGDFVQNLSWAAAKKVRAGWVVNTSNSNAKQRALARRSRQPHLK
jgi:hypothetical protein